MPEADLQTLPPLSILVASDLSARCDRALDRALLLAAAWGAELCVLHAIEDDGETVAGTVATGATTLARAQRRLREAVPDLADTITLRVEPGQPTDVVLRVAAAESAGLIVAGIARDEPAGSLRLGSTVDRLARQSTVPLLVVKRRPLRPYRNILVASDLSEPSRPALAAAAALFPAAQATLLHVVDVPFAGFAGDVDAYRSSCRDAARPECAAFVAATGLSADWRMRLQVGIDDGVPAERLRVQAEAAGSELIVLGRSGRGHLLDLLLGGTARALLADPPCDLLLVPAGPRPAA